MYTVILMLNVGNGRLRLDISDAAKISIVISAIMQLFYQNVALECTYRQYITTIKNNFKERAIPYKKMQVCNFRNQRNNMKSLSPMTGKQIYSCNHHLKVIKV